jgi:hypothetical protein
MSTLGENDRLSFGKHRGKTLGEVIKVDPQYLIWANENVSFFQLTPDQLIRCEEGSKKGSKKEDRPRRPPADYNEGPPRWHDDGNFDPDTDDEIPC